MNADPLAKRLARLDRHIQRGHGPHDPVDLSTLRVIRTQGDKTGDLRLWSMQSEQTIGAFAWYRKRRSSVSMIDFAGTRLLISVWKTEISITNPQGEEHRGHVTMSSSGTKVKFESLRWPRYLSARAPKGGDFSGFISGFMRYDVSSKFPIMFDADGYTIRDAFKTLVPWRTRPDAIEICDRMTDEPIEVIPELAATMLAVWLHARTCLIGRVRPASSSFGHSGSGGDGGI